VVTVRRSSDDAEDSFTAGEVADGTLAAFCGAGDGFVKTWHSQTGSNDATQTTAGYQPKIVSSGVVILEEGKPAIQFDGIDDRLAANGLAYVFNGNDKPYSIFVLAAVTSVATGLVVFSATRAATNPAANLYYSFVQALFFRRDDSNSGTDFTPGATPPSGRDILCVTNAGTIDTLFINGGFSVSKTADLGVFTTTKVTIGALDRITAEGFFPGTVSEVIVYPSDITAQRELIEGNIAWSYS
jgi:hypothetical protein